MDKKQERIQELEEEFKQLMEQVVYDCATDEQGQKVKSCSRCMQNMGRTESHDVTCLKELEAEQ